LTRFYSLLAVALLAGDWPRYLGPAADGSSPEVGLVAPWPNAGLKLLWECPLGVGYAPPVVAGGKLYHFDRFADAVRLTCRDAATGAEAWKVEFPTAYEDQYGYEPGPRACPVVDGDRVYIHGADGLLACVRDGKAVWQVDTRTAYHVHPNFFGAAGVPWVEGELLLVAVGGSPPGPRPVDLREAKPNGSCVVAFDKLTGTERWRAGADLASYASPTVAVVGGKRTGLYFARGGLLGFDPGTGAERFRFPWRARILESVNAANPVVVGDRVFLSECYGPGSVLLDVSGKPAVVWKDDDERSLQAHWATPIHHAGFVYGSSGRHANDADLRCVELATGAVKWRERRTTRCTLLKADGHLIVLGEGGELRLIRLNADKYDEVSRVELPGFGYPCWAPPVLSDGRLYVRGRGEAGNRLACYAIRGGWPRPGGFAEGSAATETLPPRSPPQSLRVAAKQSPLSPPAPGPRSPARTWSSPRPAWRSAATVNWTHARTPRGPSGTPSPARGRAPRSSATW
jgi:outer membrane protein assembly factor BamB